MHNEVTQALQHLRMGEPVTFKNLTMYPLLDGSSGAPDYLLLEQALQSDLVQVTEVSEAGAVNSLKVTNRAERPVLIVDGEELVGAKQNRVVNLTILKKMLNTYHVPRRCGSRSPSLLLLASHTAVPTSIMLIKKGAKWRQLQVRWRYQ